MLLMIDNYDSFTYNLVQYLAPERIVISPGPCTPNEAGVSIKVIEHFKGKLPILGVCLGHQSIGQAFAGHVIHAKNIMHGKTSEIYHNNSDIFNGIDIPFTATRYHSLVVEKNTLPGCLEITAWTEDDDKEIVEIMGLRHRDYPVYGVQFHPESILTTYGHQLLQNFLEQTL